MKVRLLLVVLVLWALFPLPAVAAPTPCPNGSTHATVPVVGRLFPEPLHTCDYIGYFEAVPSFEILARDYADRIELHRVAKSYGWINAVTQQREPNDVFVVDVTNEKSAIPLKEKIHLVFTCSVHGNEKGGREGCMRVAEDFAKGIGMAAENPELVDLLDYMVVVLAFSNTDGWAHDEPQYFAANPQTMYTRGNANGSDLNRQWPTLGYLEIDQSHKTMAEPEIAGLAAFLKDRYPNVWYAIDIHGMLNPADGQTDAPVPGNCGPTNPASCPATATEFQQWLAQPDKGHFVLGLLASQRLTQDDYIRQTRMAELIRERTQDCPGTLGPAWCQAPSTGVWGGDYNFWGTSWETIGYTSTGTTSMYMMNPYGLDAPAASYEMSYNHIVCDGAYMGCGQFMNEFHVNNVRRMVQALMEAAATDFRVSLETGGVRTAYLFNPKIVTTADADGNPRPSTGWSDENERDDRWDILHNVFVASPMDYFRDMKGFVRNGDQPGVFEEVPARDLTPETLVLYDQLVVAGSAMDVLDTNHLKILGAWVEGGGRLVLTDQALQLLESLGVVSAGSVVSTQQYVGRTEVVDFSHPIAKDLLGYSRQTYDPVTVGIPQGASPSWEIAPNEVSSRGKVVGIVPGGLAVGSPTGNANLGEVTHGAGTIRFLGALLPDPTIEHYTPYGVGGYGVTYAGNQFFVNLLGFDQVFEAPPLALEGEGNLRKPSGPEPGAAGAPAAEEGDAVGSGSGTPGPGFVAAVAALGVGLGMWRSRRRRAA